MLDQYQDTLWCEVNYNDGSFAECDIVNAVSTNPEASIDDEFWLGPSRVQVHSEMLGLDEEDFLVQYPVGRTFRMELTIRVIDGPPHAAVSQQDSPVN